MRPSQRTCYAARRWLPLVEFAGVVGSTAGAFRKRLQRTPKSMDASGMITADLGNGIIAIRLGRRWRISFPPVDVSVATSAAGPTAAGVAVSQPAGGES